VFTLTSGSYVSNNSGAITGNTIKGMFTDNAGHTNVPYTATRTPIATNATVSCHEQTAPVGSFACDASVSAPSSTQGAPSGSIDWTVTGGHAPASCTLASSSSTDASCTVTDLPSAAGNEADQTVTASYTNGGPFGKSKARDVIAPVVFMAAPKTVDTYLEGYDLAKFKVTLSRIADRPVTLDYTTRDGTGPKAAKTAEGDYKKTAGTLTFAPGETKKIIVVKCFADITVRVPSNFDVVLSNPQGGSFSSGVVGASGAARTGSMSVPRGPVLPKPVIVRGDIDPNLRIGQVDSIKNIMTKKQGVLWCRRYDSTRVFKLKEGDWVYVGDELFLDQKSVAVVTYVLGGAVAVQPGDHVTILNERRTYIVPGSPYVFLKDTLRLIYDVSHQKETMQIQTNGGVMGIKG